MIVVARRASEDFLHAHHPGPVPGPLRNYTFAGRWMPAQVRHNGGTMGVWHLVSGFSALPFVLIMF